MGRKTRITVKKCLLWELRGQIEPREDKRIGNIVYNVININVKKLQTAVMALHIQSTLVSDTDGK